MIMKREIENDGNSKRTIAIIIEANWYSCLFFPYYDGVIQVFICIWQKERGEMVEEDVNTILVRFMTEVFNFYG